MRSEAYTKALAKHRVHRDRDVLLDDLLDSYGLLDWVTVQRPSLTTAAHLQRFHDEDYVQALRMVDSEEERQRASAVPESSSAAGTRNDQLS